MTQLDCDADADDGDVDDMLFHGREDGSSQSVSPVEVAVATGR